MIPIPPRGSVPQTQAQGGVPAAPVPPRGAAPQATAQAGSVSPQEIQILRNDPDVAKAIELFSGQKPPMDQIPENFLLQVAGMVHKLGVNGAVAMLNKSFPPELLAKLKKGA